MSDQPESDLQERGISSRVSYLARTNRLWLVVASVIVFVIVTGQMFFIFVTMQERAQEQVLIRQTEVAQIVHSETMEVRRQLDVSRQKLASQTALLSSINSQLKALRSDAAIHPSQLLTASLVKRLDAILKQINRAEQIAYATNAAAIRRGNATAIASRGSSGTVVTQAPVVHFAQMQQYTKVNNDMVQFPSFASLTLSTAVPSQLPVQASAASMMTPKFLISSFVFFILGIVFLVAIRGVMTTKDPAVMSFCLDTIKTLLGFFIGVGTSYMGLQAGG